MNKERLNYYKEWIEENEEIVVDSSIFKELVDEINRLNNIIDNIEKYFENELNDFKKVKVMNLQEPTDLLELYVDVIKELKGE